MRTVSSLKRMQALSRRLAAEGKTIGLVPTMGFLHEGHLSLIRRAKKKADVVIATIFVNPAQFAPSEDLDKYPRDEKGDIKKIKEAGGDIVFLPTASEIYPPDFETFVNVEQLTRSLEGRTRPNHFRGVTTIVAKLFNITRPDLAVFGMKDYQQAAVIKRMSVDLGYPIKIIVAPTVREQDGLAMSSRNKYFDDLQRWEATCLYNALRTAREMVKAGVEEVDAVTEEMQAVIVATCPTAKTEYIAFTDLDSLESVEKIRANTVCSLAVKVHGVRLIDNMKLK
jgi:pantoate--beta-alanine ligase